MARQHLRTVLVFVLFCSLYIFLRSPQYLAVDGALRCLEVYRQPQLFFHGNNHLLYPVNIFIFHQTVSVFGVRAINSFEFIRLTQIMNCVGAAGCVAILYWLVGCATSSVSFSTFVALSFGLSHAFLLHATNSAEPVIGLFWSLLAVFFAVLSVRKHQAWLLCFSGMLSALAMATYQSMILMCLVIGVHCLVTPFVTRKFAKPSLSYSGLAFFGISGLLTLSAIYGTAYSHQGVQSFGEGVGRFISNEWQGVFGGFKLANAVNLPIGFLNSLLPVLPRDYEGIRSLVRLHPNDLWIPWLILVGSCALAFILLFTLLVWKARNRLSINEQLVSFYLLLGIAVTSLGPLYWAPTYDKLWLQPLACVLFLLAYLLKKLSPFRSAVYLSRAGVVLVAAVAFSNLAWAIPNKFHETEFLDEVRQLDEIIQPNDLTISDWDEISVLHNEFGRRGETIDLPSLAISRREFALQDIKQRIGAVAERGGQVYFLGVLDQTEQSWNEFLGEKVGLSYHAFDQYRHHCTVTARLPYRKSEITLRRLELNLSLK
jgi:hypothetical protein